MAGVRQPIRLDWSRPVQWEVEALEPVELQRLVLAAVAPYIDQAVLANRIAEEERNANSFGHSPMEGLPTAHRALISAGWAPGVSLHAARSRPTGRLTGEEAAHARAGEQDVEPPAHVHTGLSPRSTRCLTSHARVLLAIARDPAARLRTIAAACHLTERTVQVIIADLEQAGFLLRRRVGRRNQYTLNLDQPLRHPAEADLSSVRALVELAGGEVSQQRKAASASATDS